MTEKYNSLKKRVLKTLLEHGSWITVSDLARKIHLEYSERALYSYLLRLAKFGLVKRARNSQGLLFYRATERGAERFKFLNERR